MFLITRGLYNKEVLIALKQNREIKSIRRTDNEHSKPILI